MTEFHDTLQGKRIGIMGGTFDPIHYGHLLIAENAAEQFLLDEVMFMPTGISPHKKECSLTNSKLRCDMVSLAIRNNPHFSLSLQEINSSDINYTYKTLEGLKKQHPDTEFFFILGGDSLFELDSWKYPDRILKSSAVLAAIRDDWEGERFDRQITYLNKKYEGTILQLHAPNFSVSSKNIRKLISQNKTVRYMLPDDVLFYIQTYKLYRGRVVEKDLDKL